MNQLSSLLKLAVVYPLLALCQLPVCHGGADAENSVADPPHPLSQAHAHNDYEHERPLLDALEEGFTSFEADIFLVDGELLVAHYLKDTSADRTLESLYLKPLYERFVRFKGSIYPQPGGVTLLVDIKHRGAEAYAELARQLGRYSEMISVTTDDQFVEKAVTVVVSGDRPIEQILTSNPRYVGIDGRLSDLDEESASTRTVSQMPLISDNWRVHFRYRGQGEMSETERDKLRSIVARAHSQGRRVRFWATPESEVLWRELVQADVDLIGTDDLRRFAEFLRQ